MDLEFYPYDFEYIVEDKVFVRMYAKTKDGKKICVQHAHEPFFFASTKNVNRVEFEKKLTGLTIESKENHAKVISFEVVKKNLIGKEQDFYKIYTNYPKAVPVLAKEISTWGVECFEKDILFIHILIKADLLRSVGNLPLDNYTPMNNDVIIVKKFVLWHSKAPAVLILWLAPSFSA